MHYKALPSAESRGTKHSWARDDIGNEGTNRYLWTVMCDQRRGPRLDKGKESKGYGGYMGAYRPTEFSSLLKKIREEAGKSRYSLAQFSGIDEAYLLRLESAERQNPSRDVVVKLGLALVANSQSVTLHDVNGLLLAANYAPLLSRGETISWT